MKQLSVSQHPPTKLVTTRRIKGESLPAAIQSSCCAARGSLAHTPRTFFAHLAVQHQDWHGNPNVNMDWRTSMRDITDMGWETCNNCGAVWHLVITSAQQLSWPH